MKTYTKMPPVWRIGDFIAFGSGAVACIGFLIYGLIVGFQGTASAVKQAPFLLAATAAGFLFVYWRVIKIRQNDIAGFILVGGPEYGFLVNLGDYNPPGGMVELKAIVQETAKGWGTKPTADEPVFTPISVENALTSDYIWVWFKPGTQDLPFNMPGKVAGYDVYRKMVVGYLAKSTPLERTAFAHELGHVIQGTITGDWNQDTHHARAKKYGLP
jgi:hypothetical protein